MGAVAGHIAQFHWPLPPPPRHVHCVAPYSHFSCPIMPPLVHAPIGWVAGQGLQRQPLIPHVH